MGKAEKKESNDKNYEKHFDTVEKTRHEIKNINKSNETIKSKLNIKRHLDDNFETNDLWETFHPPSGHPWLVLNDLERPSTYQVKIMTRHGSAEVFSQSVLVTTAGSKLSF